MAKNLASSLRPCAPPNILMKSEGPQTRPVGSLSLAIPHGHALSAGRVQERADIMGLSKSNKYRVESIQAWGAKDHRLCPPRFPPCHLHRLPRAAFSSGAFPLLHSKPCPLHHIRNQPQTGSLRAGFRSLASRLRLLAPSTVLVTISNTPFSQTTAAESMPRVRHGSPVWGTASHGTHNYFRAITLFSLT